MHAAVTFAAKDLIIVSVAILGYTIVRLPVTKRKQALLFVLYSAVLTVVSVKLAASLHQDPRPFVSDGVKAYFSSATDNGFPSDHTVLAAFCAFVVLRYDRRLGSGLIVLALIIGTARVLGNVHHGQDIVGGFVVSAVAVAGGYGLGGLLVRHHSKDGISK